MLRAAKYRLTFGMRCPNINGHMLNAQQAALERMGLSSTEAQIYLALLHKGGRIGASVLAASAGIARSSVYPALNRLADLGLVEAEAGYGSGFSAVAPDKALPGLIARETEELSERKRLAGELVMQLESVAVPAQTNSEAELIQVLKDPRVISERFERLEGEAKHSIEVFIKAPFFAPADNPAQTKAMRRGVQIKGLYERAVLETAEIKPNLQAWISEGEEARTYEGELPHKLAIFDRQRILMPLITPGGEGRTLFVRSPQLGASLGMLFDSLWRRSEPIQAGSSKCCRPAGRLRRARRDNAETAPTLPAAVHVNPLQLDGSSATTRRGESL